MHSSESQEHSPRPHIIAALARLDELVQRAIPQAQEWFGPGINLDPFRGLRVTEDDVAALLSRPRGPALAIPHGDGSSPWEILGKRFGLDAFFLDVLVIAAAPDLDLRYERLYAYLQDDITRKRPTIELTLRLLEGARGPGFKHAARFHEGAVGYPAGLLHLHSDSATPLSSTLSRFVRVDDLVLRILRGDEGLDPRLAGRADALAPLPRTDETAWLDSDIAALLVERESRSPLRVRVDGAYASDALLLARRLADEFQTDLLSLNEEGTSRSERGSVRRLARLEAVRRGSVLFVLGDPESDRPEPDSGAQLSHPPAEISFGNVHAPLVLSLPPRPLAARKAMWRRLAMEAGWEKNADLAAVAQRFHLSEKQALRAMSQAWFESQRPDAGSPCTHLLGAARRQTAADVGEFARRREPAFSWDDLVIPDDARRQLEELCLRVEHRDRVMESWGFTAKLPYGSETTALFSGPSGTGKTMAADVVAGALGLSLIQIELSGVVSKWIGETEQRLEKVFRAAEASAAVLFIDEADALFGKRSEVKQAQDRFANMEISYLLQRMETYQGIAILATNLRQNIDDAFLRRFAFGVHFPFPDEASRLRIWQRVWPERLPLAKSIDFESIARAFPLSGGNIKNVALHAAFLAAATDGVVETTHIIAATRREFQKMGKNVTEETLLSHI